MHAAKLETHSSSVYLAAHSLDKGECDSYTWYSKRFLFYRRSGSLILFCTSFAYCRARDHSG